MSFVGGSLKLKGASSGGVTKKKKGKKDKDKATVASASGQDDVDGERVEQVVKKYGTSLND
jgi:hypothetical protein